LYQSAVYRKFQAEQLEFDKPIYPLFIPPHARKMLENNDPSANSQQRIPRRQQAQAFSHQMALLSLPENGGGDFSNLKELRYFDLARSHVSKDTLVIYLTPRKADPVVRVGKVKVPSVKEMTCVLFD
jgi:hypothetical protein